MNYFSRIGLAVLLVAPALVVAQESHRYEDKAHHDSHEWNANEDQAYHRYLNENHKKGQDFAKAKRREQDNYWKWRHAHPDNDRDHR